MNEDVKLIIEIVIAVIGLVTAGHVLKVLMIRLGLRKNHIAIGKNVDNSYVEAGANVNKIVGDHGMMNIGSQILYQDDEPNKGDIQKAQDDVFWIGK
ncbi:MAG: hypothetical protein K1W10_02280 [Lachnospiraceae bacterium]